MLRKSIFLFLAVFVILIGCHESKKNLIFLGGLFDLTGPTSQVGSEYAKGVVDYIQYINDNGGINHVKIDFFYKDYQYNIYQAGQWYETMKEKGVTGIIGWGTGDTEALAPKINADKIPFITASYSEKLVNAEEFPYIFVGSMTYSDQTKVALEFIHEKEPGASVAFIYNETAFGRSPFAFNTEDFAQKLGLKIGERIIIPLSGEGVQEKLSIMQSSYAIVNQSRVASLAIIRAMKELHPEVTLLLLNWAIDEKVAEVIGDGGDKIFGFIPYGIWNDLNLPGVQLLHEINRHYNPEVPKRTCRYIQGYINAHILLEGIQRAGEEVTGERVKEELEGLTHFDTGACYSPVTYSNLSHKPFSSLKIYTIKNGELVPLTSDLITIQHLY